LEGELTYAQMQTYNGNNGTAFVQDAVTATSSSWDQGLAGHSTDTLTASLDSVFADSGGRYGVVALNLYNYNGTLAQDQLGLVAVPEPATLIAGALMLLPFGASTIRVLRRNRSV
jgi:hypothetical protein